MKCVFIIPYFGKVKNYFELFLKSCSYNKDFNWLFITDNVCNYNYPDNFKIVKMEFTEFVNLAQEKMKIKLSLEKPYKLCDYKPAYGIICEEWIKEYDYWGYCDCDLILGDLSPVKNLMEQQYDKIFVAGHMTCYRNTYENNHVLMDELKGIGKIYQIVYSNPQIYAFDEAYYAYNINTLFKQRGLKIFEQDFSYNCSTKHRGFCRIFYDVQTGRWLEEKEKNDQIYWENGKVFRLTKKGLNIEKQEFIYIHLQMRSMEYDSDVVLSDKIKIEANRFKKIKELPDTVKKLKENTVRYIDFPYMRDRVFYIKRRIQNKQRVEWDRPWEYNPYE